MQRGILALLLSIGLAGCESEAERERERGRRVQPASSTASDGSIHLTDEQIRTNNIQTTAAVTKEIAPAITAVGRIKPRAGAESQVFAPFAGKVVLAGGQTPHLGDEVREGQLLAEVEQIFAAPERVQFKAASLQLQTEIDHARQELELRQKEMDRARQLYDGGAIPLKELQGAEFSLKQAETKLEGAQRAKAEYDETFTQQSQQRRTPIRAPLTGTVAAIDLVDGQQVEPSKGLVTILDTTTVWAELAIRETDLAQTRRPISAEIVVSSDPNRIYRGRLVNVGIRVEVAAAARRYQLALRSSGLIRTGVVDETEAGLAITQLAYRLGNARLTDLILQQRSLIEAQLAELSARAEVSAAQAALDSAVGMPVR